MQEQGITVQHYELSLSGLKIQYNSRQELILISCDAFAACHLLKEAGLIEGFDSDGNEPMILYQDINIKPYGWSYWCDFVRTFPFSIQQVQEIAEYHYGLNHFESFSVGMKKAKYSLQVKEVNPPFIYEQSITTIMNTFQLLTTKLQLQEQWEKAIAAIEKYRKEKYEDVPQQRETLEELVYQLLEQKWFSEKVQTYEQNIVILLSLLMQPEASKVMNKFLNANVQGELSEMLLNLYDFFRQLSGEYYLLNLELVKWKQYEGEDIRDLEEVEQTYAAKLCGFLSEKISREAKQESTNKIKEHDLI